MDYESVTERVGELALKILAEHDGKVPADLDLILLGRLTEEERIALVAEELEKELHKPPHLQESFVRDLFRSVEESPELAQKLREYVARKTEEN